MTETPARRRADRWLLGALGVAGVVLGHTVVYIAVEPAGPARATLLAETGHLYWNAAVAMAAVAAGWAVVSHGAARFRHSAADDGGTGTLRGAALRLGLLQVAAYTVMEAGERATAHAAVSSMFSHHLFAAGIAVQVLVAVLLVQVLRLVGRAAEAVGRVRAKRRRALGGAAVTSPWDGPRVAVHSVRDWTSPSRAPPLVRT